MIGHPIRTLQEFLYLVQALSNYAHRRCVFFQSLVMSLDLMKMNSKNPFENTTLLTLTYPNWTAYIERTEIPSIKDNIILVFVGI